MTGIRKIFTLSTVLTLLTVIFLIAQPSPISNAAVRPYAKTPTAAATVSANSPAVMLPAAIAQSNLAVISTTNAGQVAQLALLGRGRSGSIAWSSDGKTIAIGTTLGIWLYQATALDAVPLLMLGHTGKVIGLAFSADNKSLVSLGEDAAIGLWDVGAGKLVMLAKSKGGDGPAQSIAWSPDGKKLATGSYNKTVQIYDAATLKPLASWKGHTDIVNSVVFSPDGKLLASSSADKTIILWDTTSGKPAKTLTGSSSGVGHLAFSPDGKLLASAGTSGKGIQLWDVSGGKALTPLVEQDYIFTPLAFSPDGKTLVGGSNLLDAATGNKRATLQCGGGNGIVFSPDGKTIATTGGGAPELCDAQTGATVTVPSGDEVGPNSLVFSPDSKFALYAGGSGYGRLWDITAGKIAANLLGYTSNNAVFSADGKTVTTYGYEMSTGNQAVVAWDLGTSQQKTLAKLENASGIFNGTISPDGTFLITGGYDKPVQMFDATTGKVQPSINIDTKQMAANVLISPDSKTLVVVVGSFNKTELQIIDVASGKTTYSLNVKGSPYPTFTADGKRLAYVDDNGVIQMIDFTGKAAGSIKIPQSAYVSNMTFSPDGKLVAAQDEAGVLKLFDATTGKLLATLQGPHGLLRQIVFSLDGKLVASTGDDGTARLWGVASK